MLQWMGGSRRKVTTSRKSTQKRQKQYFEQRKLQQKNSHGLESYSDKKDPITSCHENNRSLDILSLLNLSKNGQDFTSKFPEGRRTPNSQTAHCPTPVEMQNDYQSPSEHVEIRETRTVSNQMEETECPQKFLFDFSSSSHPDASKRNNEKDPMKLTTDHKLSVVDMLGDDGQNNSSRGNLVHENHVSFSVEGLGKVKMETPLHSPQHPTRNFSYGSPLPSKIFKGSHSYKNHNYSLEDQFPELDEFSENRVDHDRFKWHERSSFLDDDNFLDDNCGVSWNNWSCDFDYMISRKCDKSDFYFEGCHMPKRRARVDPPDSFNVSGLSSPYKHQIDHNFDFMTSDMTREDSFLSYPSFNSTERQKTRHVSDSRTPFSTKNTTFPHEFGAKSPNIWQQHNTKISPDFSTDWLFEEKHNTKSYSKTWTENQFDPNLYYNEKEYGHGHQDPHDGFFNEEKDDSNVQLQKSVSTRESESVTLPAVTSMLHQHTEDKSHESNNYSSSKNGTSTNVLDSEESKVKTPEMTPCVNVAVSPEQSEGGASSVEMPHCDGSKE